MDWKALKMNTFVDSDSDSDGSGYDTDDEMVVVSGGWAKSPGYTNCGDVIGTSKMAAKAVLICRPNSHPFQERSLTLDQPVKIGRSVARARAAPNNAIFDCKVLSRNHALLWYENGKFYLQDTKSSNGTFVNNQRLSKGAEESPPREVCSGDIVQFGVDVMENTHKVTHGCIVATLKLYLPDGKEAKASPSTSVVSSVGVVPLEDLYTLNQYLQEALQREQQLENKLMNLQLLVDSTRQASEDSWRALIDEDRLLSRVEILENQLQMYSKNYAEDKLREELRKLQEDKSEYQGAAKESIRKILQEKLDAVQKMQDLERSLRNTEEECSHLKEVNEKVQNDLQELALKYSTQLSKMEELSSKLQETEEQHREVCERLEQEKQELQARLQEQLEAERALQIRLEALQADGDMAQRQLAVLQSHLQSLQPNDDVDTKIDVDSTKSTDSTGTQVDIILERIQPDNMKDTLQNPLDEIENLKAMLKKSEEELRENNARMETLCQQLDESRAQENSSSQRICELQQRLEALELDLELERVQGSKIEGGSGERKHGPLESDSAQTKKLLADIQRLEEDNHDLEICVEHYACMRVLLEELLAESRAKQRVAEAEQLEYEQALDLAKLSVTRSLEEVKMLKQQLLAAENSVQEKSESVTKMYEQMQWLETSADEVKLQVRELQDRLREEQDKSSKNAGDAEILRNQLMEAQQAAKQSRNEAEQMKDRLRALQEELKRTSDNRNREELTAILQRCEALEELNERVRLEKENLEAVNQALKNSLETNAQASHSNVDNSQDLLRCRAERDQLAQAVSAMQEEMIVLREGFAVVNESKAQLSQELKALREEWANLTPNQGWDRTQLLVIMIIAIFAFYLGLMMF